MMIFRDVANTCQDEPNDVNNENEEPRMNDSFPDVFGWDNDTIDRAI